MEAPGVLTLTLVVHGEPFFEDGSGRGGPNEGLWIGIVLVEVLLDGSLEFGNSPETRILASVEKSFC
jgi:hypothetical protein